MTPTKPLSYLSLKCVLEHMDPNWRYLNHFKFSPTLRKMMRDLPLHIEDLKLDETSFTVNTVKFYVGTLFVDSEENTPERWPSVFRDCGLPWDVDSRGFQDFSQPLAPGDIPISAPRRPRYHTIQSEEFRPYTRFNIFDLQPDGYGRFREVLWFAGRFPEGTKVHDVIRRLLKNFIGNANPIVRNLEILATHGTLKLSEHLKLDVKNLMMEKTENRDSVMTSIKPILKGPLKSVTGYFPSSEDPVLENEALKNTRIMKIKAHTTVGVVLKCPALEIYVLDTQFKLEDILEIIRNWMEHPRRIGSKFTMLMNMIPLFLDLIMERLNEAKKSVIPGKCDQMFPNCLTIQLGCDAELNIYGMEQKDWTEARGKSNRWKDVFVMEVIEKGAAQLLE